jgi:SAM-dependent methyltransferase
MNIVKTASAALNSYKQDVLWQHYLDVVYRDIGKVYSQELTSNRDISETNGELLYVSINKLFAHVTLTDQDVFFDLGSGLGKMILHVYLQTPVKEVYGIELLVNLHKQAMLAAERVKHDLGILQAVKKMEFICGDFFEINFNTATVVFINSVCFGQDIMLKLEKIINSIPSIHTVITLRPMDNLQHVSFKKSIHLQGSWDAALGYIYQR